MFFLNEKNKAWFLRIIFSVGALVLFSGFDMSRYSIPVDEILSGGPPKDGIPALSQPKFVTVKAAENFMKDDDRVLGLARNGEAKAYPIKILNWHEIVNDTIGSQAVVVTFCPLCGTGMVFDGKIKGKNLTFGVSGLLYQSDMLLYDRKTDSLWSQIKREAVTGPLMGARLQLLSSTQTSWSAWKKLHPETRVLSRETGHQRDYDRDPYKGYYKSSRLMFTVKNQNKIYHPKERVIGLEIDGKFKAYPFSELAQAQQPVADKLNGIAIEVTFDKKSQTAVIRDSQGKALPTVVGFWFAWFTFHPDTGIYKASQ
ncbi:hypothetical protein MNBD_NITROSPINAE05-131 [hydrothermal vent metagenome]|uniref:DUF3179 domain-containing protein n=1 Tax=hydrothermal vent metagenome TaxID=652676 RepID=A0A3B1DAF1_9ZZZZ